MCIHRMGASEERGGHKNRPGAGETSGDKTRDEGPAKQWNSASELQRKGKYCYCARKLKAFEICLLEQLFSVDKGAIPGVCVRWG